jgi:hypothetical protein
LKILGNFGQVFRGLWNETIDVAMKTPKGGDFSDFKREIAVLRFQKKVTHY